MTAPLDWSTNDSRTVLHWYDFICPFCYIAQNRNAILERRGFHVVELPFQAHPEIPPGGISLGLRHGSMYTTLEREAAQIGLRLNWPQRLPNTRLALAAAEWTRRHQSQEFPSFRKALFEAHFALGENLADPAVIDRHASSADVNLASLHAALADGSASAFVSEAELAGRGHGVQGTPAWLVNGHLLTGLISAAEFDRLADDVLYTLK